MHLPPVLHFVLMNASALLVVAGQATDHKDGICLAMEILENMTSGSAWKALERFRDGSLIRAYAISSITTSSDR